MMGRGVLGNLSLILIDQYCSLYVRSQIYCNLCSFVDLELNCTVTIIEDFWASESDETPIFGHPFLSARLLAAHSSAGTSFTGSFNRYRQILHDLACLLPLIQKSDVRH
jgi:hypothetical protein